MTRLPVRRRFVRAKVVSAALFASVLIVLTGGAQPPVPKRQIAEDSDPPRLPDRALLRLGTDNLRLPFGAEDMAFFPDAKQIAAVSVNERPPTAYIFELTTGRLAKRLSAPQESKGFTTTVAVSPDGSKLLWGEVAGMVALWDVDAGRQLFHEKLHGGSVNDVGFSPDGNLFFSAGIDGVIQMRSVADPAAPSRKLSPGEAETGSGDRIGGRGGARSVSFTKDGKYLMAGTGSNAALYIWQVGDGSLVRKVDQAHGGPGGPGLNSSLTTIAVTPDGKHVFTSGQRTFRESKRSSRGASRMFLSIRSDSGTLKRENLFAMSSKTKATASDQRSSPLTGSPLSSANLAPIPFEVSKRETLRGRFRAGAPCSLPTERCWRLPPAARSRSTRSPQARHLACGMISLARE